MLLRAVTVQDTIVQFSLSDCPVYLSTTKVALVGRKNSELLNHKTIMRGDPQTGVFEGDKIFEDGEYIGYVIYSCGFKVQNIDGSLKPLELGRHIRVEEGNVALMEKVFSNPERTRLYLKHNNCIFQMGIFLYKRPDGRIATTGRSYRGHSLNPDEVQFCTGLTVNGEQLFYGDKYKGGEVVIHNSQPCIRIGNEYRRILK